MLMRERHRSQQEALRQQQRAARRAVRRPTHKPEVLRAGKDEMRMSAHDAHDDLDEERVAIFAHLFRGKQTVRSQCHEHHREQHKHNDTNHESDHSNFLQ